MADATKEEHERMMVPIAQCAERLRACATSADEAAKAFAVFAEAARKLELPPLQEIARMRMAILAADHGLFRFVMPAWWRWWWVMVRPNDRVQARPEAVACNEGLAGKTVTTE